MSVTLAYVKPNDLSQLHDELRAAGLAPERVEGERVTVVTPGAGEDDPGVVAVEDRIALTFPDGQAAGPVDAVVAAHTPRVRYDPATRLAEVEALRRQSRRAALRVKTAAATTVADFQAVLLEHLADEHAERAEEEAAG